MRGSWEVDHPVYMCFEYLEKSNKRIPRRILLVLLEYRLPESLLWAILSLYNQNKSCVHILDTSSSLFTVNAGLGQVCPLLPILFVVFMDRILRYCWEEESVWFGNQTVASLLFADDVVLSASSSHDHQRTMDRQSF